MKGNELSSKVINKPEQYFWDTNVDIASIVRLVANNRGSESIEDLATDMILNLKSSWGIQKRITDEHRYYLHMLDTDEKIKSILELKIDSIDLATEIIRIETLLRELDEDESTSSLMNEREKIKTTKKETDNALKEMKNNQLRWLEKERAARRKRKLKRKRKEQPKQQKKSQKEKVKNAYSMLGLTTDASDKDKKLRFFELARKYHPDKHSIKDSGFSKEDGIEMFKAINEAYNTVK